MKNIRVNEIDLLRFFAALSVVFFHYSFRGYAADNLSAMPYPLMAPISKYGYLGVELFFMISGFVILMTAAKGSLRDFFISRVVRLYPAFWACCTITFALSIAAGTLHYPTHIGQYLVNMTMLSDFVGVPSIDGSYWSLFVELRFYAIVAIVLAIGRIHRAQMLIFIWLVASVILEIYPIDPLRNLLITEYAAFFISGAAYFLIWSGGPSPTRVAIVTLSWWLAMFQSINGLQEFEKHYSVGMSRYVVAGIVTIFFAAMMLIALRRTGLVGRSRWLLAGILTYPLYLLHQNIGYMAFNIAYPTFNAHLVFWGTVVAVLASAYAVHFVVEKRLSSPMKAALNKMADGVQRLTNAPLRPR